MPITSRLEQARDEIVAEFEGITTANGYRNNPNVYRAIRPLDRVREFPEIGIEIGDCSVEYKDSTWTVYDVVADVHVVGAVEAATSTGYESNELVDAAESLRHDIMRKVSELANHYTGNSASSWLVTPRQQIRYFGPLLLGEKRNKALTGCSFSIRIWKCSNTFAYEVAGDDTGSSGTVIIDGGT
jgi:hypothetical protein